MSGRKKGNKLEAAPPAKPTPKKLAKEGRRRHTARSDQVCYFDGLDDDLLMTVWSFLAPAERFQSLAKVCKRWRDGVAHDPGLWELVVLTRNVPNYAKLSPTRKLYYTYEPGNDCCSEDVGNDPTLDEYHPNRLSQVGVLPLTPQQLAKIPNPSWVQTLFIHASWREAGGAYYGEDESFNAMYEEMLAEQEDNDYDDHLGGIFGDEEDDDGEEDYDDDEDDGEEEDENYDDDEDDEDDNGAYPLGDADAFLRSERREISRRRAKFKVFMQEVMTLFDTRRGVLRLCTSLRALHFPFEWTMPYGSNLDSKAWITALAQWLSACGGKLEALDLGVIARGPFEETKHSKTFAALNLRKALPKSLPSLVHLPAFDTTGTTPGEVRQWPARFRASVQTASINVATTVWSGGSADTRKAAWQVQHIASLSALLPNLTRLRIEANHLDRELFDAILALPTSLRALYVVVGSPRTSSPKAVPYADSRDWQRFARFEELDELVLCFEADGSRLNRKGSFLDGALALALPCRANILVTTRSNILENSVCQLGFDIIYHESGAHQYGGLRPLHRALLPGRIEPWHLHAVEMKLEEAGCTAPPNRRRGQLLTGPLAEGEGPAAWLSELEEVRQEEASL
jgi:hypothetical protein